jgi:hypothetical protein
VAAKRKAKQKKPKQKARQRNQMTTLIGNKRQRSGSGEAETPMVIEDEGDEGASGSSSGDRQGGDRQNGIMGVERQDGDRQLAMDSFYGSGTGCQGASLEDVYYQGSWFSFEGTGIPSCKFRDPQAISATRDS